jgi:hypothetical protein
MGGAGGAGGAGGGGGGGGNGGNGGCSDQAKLVYVIDSNGTLSSFAPNQTDVTKSVFTDIGQLSCPTKLGSGTPFSMSVDRSAVAWIEYVGTTDLLGTKFGSELYSVSTSTAACTATNYKSGQHGFIEFGMGFVSNAAMSDQETLFVAGGAAPAAGAMPSDPPPPTYLGTLDTAALSINQLSTTALKGRPELTGTGNAELFGFYPDPTNPHIAKLDKTNGNELSVIPLTMLKGNPQAWAFAFWGGDYWVFLQRASIDGIQPPPETATVVYHVKPDGTVTSWPTNGRTIVGAGVSTCAPTIPIT